MLTGWPPESVRRTLKEMRREGELVADLTVRPPEHLPKELVESLKAEELAATKQRSRTAYKALVALGISWLVMPFLGIKSFAWMGVLYVSLIIHTAYTWRASRTGTINIPLGLGTAMLFIVCSTRMAGVWILTPIIMCGVLIGFTRCSAKPAPLLRAMSSS